MFHRGPGGLPIPGRKKKRGLGFTGWAIIGGVFVFGGGGAYVAKQMDGLGGSCRVMMQNVGLSASICNPFDGGMRKIASAIPEVGSVDALSNFKLPGNMRQFTRELEQMVDTDAFQAAIGSDLAQHIDIDALRQMDRAMGGTLDMALSETQKLSMALSQTALGNGMLSGQFGGSSDPTQAVQWYEQGASMGDYGILSQLSLGNMYASGQHTAPDFGRAEHFYQEALLSLKSLERKNTQEAKTLLNNLPADPDTLKAQLEQQLSRLNAKGS